MFTFVRSDVNNYFHRVTISTLTSYCVNYELKVGVCLSTDFKIFCDKKFKTI